MRLRLTIITLLGILAVGSVYLAWQGWQALQQGWWSLEVENLPPGVPSGYAKRWIAGEPCALPCWEGVTPGRTTVADAIKILNQNPGIIAGSVITGTSPGFLTWKWVGSERGGEARYDPNAQPPTITFITPYYEMFPGSAPSFTLEEVIQRYGEPSHVIAQAFYGPHADGPFYTLTIIYAQQGVSFERSGSNQTKPILSQSMRLDSVSFHPLPFDPGPYSDVWQGFTSFDAYCREAPGYPSHGACQ
jgi:hypothetical protein